MEIAEGVFQSLKGILVNFNGDTQHVPVGIPTSFNPSKGFW
ncbi:hypothetical protein CKA32_001395 [Geitlerinema sp. FC II]|nr:hypothetical protein CKA32_001395 [Geitlerinema sp. FC II]